MRSNRTLAPLANLILGAGGGGTTTALVGRLGGGGTISCADTTALIIVLMHITRMSFFIVSILISLLNYLANPGAFKDNDPPTKAISIALALKKSNNSTKCLRFTGDLR